MSIRPRDLPKRRNQLLQHLTDSSSALSRVSGPPEGQSLDDVVRQVRAAELYWVAADMAALAMSAGESLNEARWGPDVRPAPCGLALFDGGIGSYPKPLRGVDLPVDACSWGPAVGGCLVVFYSTRRRVMEAGATADPATLPPLIPYASTVLPVGGPVPLDEAAARDDVPVPVIAALAASWLLMQQPTLAERASVRPDKSTRATTQRLGMGDPEVSVVDLRRLYRPDDREEDGEEGGRRFRHRWVVSGHWRDQAYGPDRALRRQTWIAAYVKGPDGAPLLATERVNVWRR